MLLFFLMQARPSVPGLQVAWLWRGLCMAYGMEEHVARSHTYSMDEYQVTQAQAQAQAHAHAHMRAHIRI